VHEANPVNGLVRDNTRYGSPASIAAVGFGLSCYPVGVERGILTREDAIARSLTTLRFFHESPQGPQPDATGHRGFYYHFLDMKTGRRAHGCELSTMDTAILMAGVLTAAAYFDRATLPEREIRKLADLLYRRQYAVRNPRDFVGYGEFIWGITASDGPGHAVRSVRGRRRRFFPYAARGVPYGRDDGTLSPWAVVASLPFTPEIVVPTIQAFNERYPGTRSHYGFLCSFNPTFPGESRSTAGWISKGYYGLDQGPIVLMIENYRSGLIWRLMLRCSYLVRGLRRAGFAGGWLGL
jgi:hypothetical protein